MNRNKTSKRDEIKKGLRELFGNHDTSDISTRLTNIYNEGYELYQKKGYDDETSRNKTIATMGLFIPEGYAIGWNPDIQKIEIAKIQ